MKTVFISSAVISDQQRSSSQLHLSVTRFKNQNQNTTAGPLQPPLPHTHTHPSTLTLPRQMNMYKSARCVSGEADPTSRFDFACIRFSITGAKFDLASIRCDSSGIMTTEKTHTSTGPSQIDASWDGGVCTGNVDAISAGGLEVVPHKFGPLQEQMKGF